MRRLIALACLLFATSSFAAVPTVTITGNVVNAGAAAPASGTIECTLNPVAGSATDTLTGRSVRVGLTPYKLTVASDGSISGALIANSLITPAGTTYVCTYRLNVVPAKPWSETWDLSGASGSIDIGAISRPGVTALAVPTISGAAGTAQGANGTGGLQPMAIVQYTPTYGPAQLQHNAEIRGMQGWPITEGAQFYAGSKRSNWLYGQMYGRSETINAVVQPTAFAWIGDSIDEFLTRPMARMLNNAYGLSGLGYESLSADIYGGNTNARTRTITGCTTTANSTVSGIAWGISGGNVSCSPGNTVVYQLTAPYGATHIVIWYAMQSGGGTINYAVNGGANGSGAISTNGSTALGSTTISASANDMQHNLTLTFSGSAVTLYGIETYSQAHDGVEPLWLVQGGTARVWWAQMDSGSSFLAQFLAAKTPALIVDHLGTNDASVSTAAATYDGYLTTTFARYDTAAPNAEVVVVTKWSKGTGASENTTFRDFVDQYRDKELTQARTRGYSVWDLRRFWGDYSSAYARGLYGDGLHPSDTGQGVMAAGVVAWLGAQHANPDWRFADRSMARLGSVSLRSGNYGSTSTPATLTANRTEIVPDASGTRLLDTTVGPAAAQAYVAPYGNPQWLTKPAVWDIFSDVFHQRWLVDARKNSNATKPAHCTGTGAGTCAASQAYTCVQGTLIGGNSIDMDADGTADLSIGDVFYFGSAYADSGTPPTTKTYVASTIANGAGAALNECPSGEQKVGVLTYIDRNSTDVNADGTIDSGLNQVALAWMNNAHPAGGISYMMGYHLGKDAPRLPWGTNGPNLLANSEVNEPNGLSPMIPPEFTGDSTAATLTTQVAWTASHPSGNFANCIDGGTGVGDCTKYTAATNGSATTGWLQTKTLMKLQPGKRYVVSAWIYPENVDDAWFTLACDTKGDGTLAEVTATRCVPGTAFITDRNEAHYYWCTMEAPRGYDQCALRYVKSAASAVTNRPLLDDVEFRELGSYVGDAFGAVTQYLIPGDPGTRNIVYTGNSWAVDTGSGSHGFAFKTGLLAGLQSRFGRSFAGQVYATGVNGDKASNLLTNWATEVTQYHPLICIFALGVNDAGVNGAPDTEDTYATNIRQVAAKAMGEGCLPIFLSTPPAITQGWKKTTTYTAGIYVTSDTAPVKIYSAQAGCTSGTTAPTGTGTPNDGGCTWNYVKSDNTATTIWNFHTRERQVLLNWGF